MIESTQTESTKTARELNDEILYLMYAVFRVRTDVPGLTPGRERDTAVAEAEQLFESMAGKNVYTRGSYSVSGYRADADVLMWWTCPDPDGLQETYQRFRQTRLGCVLEPVWSVMGLHRPAEFNRSHIPAFVRREQPRRYLCVYPFVRSLEWYLLDPEERRSMLAEHGQMAREYPDVRSNTVACFGLNDYEWLLGFEADELHRIVDLMRHLRGAAARRHTREELPFYTGVAKPIAEIVADLPE
jgi:peroxiredoxin